MNLKYALAGALAVSSVAQASTYSFDNFHFTFPDWKAKAVTMAYDDAITTDRKMVGILNKYGLKSTFYISANRTDGRYDYGEKKNWRFLPLDECRSLYAGHEIGSHGLDHLSMTKLSDEEAERQISEDLRLLEPAAGYPIRSFAYPYGACDERIKGILSRHGIRYARVTGDKERYNIVQDDLAWHATCHHNNDLLNRADKFIAYKGFAGILGVFSVWGHSYEFEKQNNWDVLEKFCEKMQKHADTMWFATNGDVYDYVNACHRLVTTMDGKVRINMSSIPLYAEIEHITIVDGKWDVKREKIIIPPRSYAVADVPAKCAGGTYLAFPGGRTKALTFSYDDGFMADEKLIEVFNEYGVKGTFNVCSRNRQDFGIYKGHEVACHGYDHVTYSLVSKSLIASDLARDRMYLESKVGYPVRGHAYPNGDLHGYGDRTRDVLKGLDFVYARGTGVKDDFELPSDWYNWPGTARNTRSDFVESADRFLAAECKPALCNVWGHASEFTANGGKGMAVLRKFLDKVAKRDDIWYATNMEIYEYVNAARNLHWSEDRSMVRNDTAVPIYQVVDGKMYVIRPGELVRFK